MELELVKEGNHAYKENSYPFYRTITVRTQFKGLHAYENAPENVAFLRANHRHLFKVEATISVNHDNRDLEFFTVQDELERLILPFITLQKNLGSCEMIAERIATGLINLYGVDRDYKVMVSEDGESDGTVEFLRVRYAHDQLLKSRSSSSGRYHWQVLNSE